METSADKRDESSDNDYLLCDEILALLNEDSNDGNEEVANQILSDDLKEGVDKVERLTLIEDENIFTASTEPLCDNDVLKTEVELFGDLSDDEFKDNHEYLTTEGKQIKANLDNASRSQSLFSRCADKTNTNTDSWKSKSKSATNNSDDNTLRDVFSGIRIKNPLISSTELKERMEGRKMIKMSLIRSHINKTSNDIEGDWVTIGVIVSKLPPKTSKNGKLFSIWKLSDMKTPSTVSFFLFGEVHINYWKLPVGSVIGLLNSKIMSTNKDSKFANGELCSLTIDNSGKLMFMGTAKDLGFCKAMKKSNEVCGALINSAEAKYCVYHTRTAYKKFSARRAEIQNSFSNAEPNKHAISGLRSNAINSKLQNPITQTQSNATNDANEVKLKNRTQIKEKKDSESKALSKMIINPLSVAARNLAVFVNTNDSKRENTTTIVQSAEDVFRMLRPKTDNSLGAMEHIKPTFAKGCKPGQMISLCRPTDAKIRAVSLVKAKPIKREDPNQVKSKLKRPLDSIINKIESASNDNQSPLKRKKMSESKDEFFKQYIEAALKRKSSHENEANVAEMNAQEKYFNNLETKEELETKLQNTTEIECNVISCKDCKYTAHSASELCKKRVHRLTRHKATKRFFKCKNCKHRCFTFNLLLPIKNCTNCGRNSFAKTSVCYIKDGPKLETETLLIRGEEQPKFLNSLR